jgi:hypothetical protein
MKTVRWHDWANLLLGLWMFLSVAVLAFPPEATAAPVWNLLAGGLIAFCAGMAIRRPEVWEEVANVILGVGLMASPWLFGYAATANLTTNSVVVGLLVTVCSCWGMLRDAAVHKWMVDHHLLHS